MISPESSPVPPKLQGAWRRSGLVIDGDRRIDFYDVLWLQTEAWYADIRLPLTALRPQTSDGVDVNFARDGAFAGPADLSDDDVMTWKHALDLRENPDSNDSSPIQWLDGRISEGGTKRWDERDVPWTEEWTRLEDETAESSVEMSDRYLRIAVGKYAIEVVDQRPSGLFVATRFDAAQSKRASSRWVEVGSVRSAA